jgi:hypothetical protein
MEDNPLYSDEYSVYVGTLLVNELDIFICRNLAYGMILFHGFLITM